MYSALHVNSSLLQIVGGSISAFANFTVCLTYLLFKDLQNLRYVELVFYVSVNDFIASVGIALGGSPTGSFVCWFQAIVTNWQYLTAIFWTTVIAYQLWLATEKNQTIQDMTYIHLFCWLFPPIVTFLPLTTDTFGNSDDHSTWCFVAKKENSPNWTVPMWDILSYYLWVWLSILTSFYFVVQARRAVMRAPQETELQKKNAAMSNLKIRRLVLYPIIISMCWIISTVTDLYVSYHSEVSVQVYNAATFFAASQGVFLSIVFFYVNPMIRHKWLILFENVYFYLKSFFVEDKGSDKHNSRSIDRGVSFGGPNRPSSANNRGTLAWATASDLSYSLEDEPDYIKPRGKSSLSERPTTTIELQASTSVRSSMFSSFFSSSAPPPPPPPTAVTSSPSRNGSSNGPIRNPVIHQSGFNNVTVGVTDDNEIRDSEMSVDSV